MRDALKAQGFGVLTEIDMRATLRDKLGEDMEDYLILGACNPSLAHHGLAAAYASTASGSTQTFGAAEEEIVAFRCTGKRLLPIFLASFAVPRLALKLVRD